MPTVTLRSPLKQRAGRDSVEVAGATLSDVVEGLERVAPALRGWVTDEQGRIRRHVNVFINGEPAEPGDAVGPSDRVDIIHAITGGER